MNWPFDALGSWGLASHRLAQTSGREQSMWGRLSLRWQVALAVLVPAIVISVLSSLYFPPRQVAICHRRLKERAIAVGLLAQEQAAAAMAHSGAERTEALERLFSQVTKGGGVGVQA